ANATHHHKTPPHPPEPQKATITVPRGPPKQPHRPPEGTPPLQTSAGPDEADHVRRGAGSSSTQTEERIRPLRLALRATKARTDLLWRPRLQSSRRQACTAHRGQNLQLP